VSDSIQEKKQWQRQDAIDVTCRLPVLIKRGDGDAVAHQAADPREFGIPRYGRQAMPLRQFDEPA
jgi:hypothetical protein